MKQQSHGAYILSVGFAMFSMFFGAGNIVFPLIIGAESQGHIFVALLGLCITAVGVPFLGLYAMTFLDGEYRPFFEKIGKAPGFAILILLMGLIGPFGAMPRCIALSYSTFSMFIPTVSAVVFSLASVIGVYFLTVKKSKVIDILGIWLTPILLFSLGLIVVRGIFFHNNSSVETGSLIASSEAFTHGLISGYQTMDLIGAFFFCHFVVNALKKISLKDGHLSSKLLTKNTLISSLIGSSLLGLVYCGLAYVASKHSEILSQVGPEKALAVLAYYFLGSWGGIVTCLAVILACLTTVIALAAVFSEFVHKDVTQSKLSYKSSLVITLIASFFISILEFQGIFRMLAPIVQVLYPSLIVLSIINIASHGWDIPIGRKASLALVSLTALAAILSNM